MSVCNHENVECLNYYELIRKYRCLDCGGIFICECYREVGERLLPHQLREGSEYGTRKRYPVNGFAEKICENCRGEEVEPYPMGETRYYSKKLDRYYWHEIHMSYLDYVLNWMESEGVTGVDIIAFGDRFADIHNQLWKKAREKWRKIHAKNPKYDYDEETEASFLSRVDVETEEVEAEYSPTVKGEEKIGKWLNKNGEKVGGEGIAEEYYRDLGYGVVKCERSFITTIVGSFLYDAISDPKDPRIRRAMGSSTRGWTPDNRNTGVITFLLPEDFGSNEYYLRRKEVINWALDDLSSCPDLESAFEDSYKRSEPLRNYLWVNEDYHHELGKEILGILPKETVIKFIKWVIEDFWHRQSGWPDLLIHKKRGDYKFIEVKTPKDKLNQNQMQWFEWAVNDGDIPCGILRVKRKRK
jgi:hypothetical protein